MQYFSTQKEKDEHDAMIRKAYANMPTPERTQGSSTTTESRPPAKKKFRRPPPSGFKLGDVMPQELKDKAYAYRRRQNRDRIRKSK